MTIEARREYLVAIRERYGNSTKKQKSLILEEFCKVCGYSRKYAIRILQGKVEPRRIKPGPKPVYDDLIVYHLYRLWQEMGQMCSKLMVAAIPKWLPYYKDPTFNEEIESKLAAISASSIDRLLAKRKKALRGLSTTRPSAFMKSKIPIELIQGLITRPGFIEADTVAHCGNSAAGPFISTLTMTDLATAWTENRATWRKQGEDIVKQIADIERSLPFKMHGFSCDNGSEFLNESLVNYFKDNRPKPVQFARRRPYKKNDAAHVEQKNDATVRQIFGYERFDDQSLVDKMNEIYKVIWNPLVNYFKPTLKLMRKERIGGRLRKFYDKPRTPYQRLLESEEISDERKERLRGKYYCLNPFTLRIQLDESLKAFMRRVKELNYQRSLTDDQTDGAA